MTKVKFYLENTKEVDVFAVFPDLIFDSNGNITSYAYIGQHSACSKEYLKHKRLATPEQYNDLLNELKRQGYDDLIVLNVPISKEDQRQLDIDAGKIYQCYKEEDNENILFEGSRSACIKWAKTNFPIRYKHNDIRIGKLIYENHKLKTT